jgi:hypothetical protein
MFWVLACPTNQPLRDKRIQNREAIAQEVIPVNRQSHLQRALLGAVLSAATTAVAGTANICQLTSQDGLNSCKKGAQGDYWTAVGMCANISEPQSQQACIQKAKSDYQSAITTCQDQFTTRKVVELS